MDAAQALADLIEVSSQIEGAVLTGPKGGVAASTWPDADRAKRVAQAAGALVSAAEETQAGRSALTQLHASSDDGGVFCVREGDRTVAAVTKPDPTVGLVFYDLRTCLRLATEEAAKKPARKPVKKTATKPAKTPAKKPTASRARKSRKAEAPEKGADA